MTPDTAAAQAFSAAASPALSAVERAGRELLADGALRYAEPQHRLAG